MIRENIFMDIKSSTASLLNRLQKRISRSLEVLLFGNRYSIYSQQLFAYHTLSFSQEGEDLVLKRVFEGQEQGFFVDVGAHHPQRFSNTYLFYLKGWRGINIDAMPDSMEPFEDLRPEDINIESAISDVPEVLTYYLFNEPAIEYLSQLNLSDKSIFEWGSGNSSLFFAQRSKEIISIESDREWYNYISQNLLPNQKVFFQPEANFVESIDDISTKFDIIIIDSLRRYECALKAISYLKEGGFIILDNSDWHPKTSKCLREKADLIEVDLHGFGPINEYSWTTSLYFHREFRFCPRDNIQPNYSKAAIHIVSEYDNFV